MTEPKKRIKTKKRTLSEFNAWLDGIEEMQAPDWHPDKTQWDIIRANIKSIVEEIVEVEVTTTPVTGRPLTEGHTRNAQKSSLINNVEPVAPPPAPNPSVIDNKPDLKQDIDTSDGKYTSDFI